MFAWFCMSRSAEFGSNMKRMSLLRSGFVSTVDPAAARADRRDGDLLVLEQPRLLDALRAPSGRRTATDRPGLPPGRCRRRAPPTGRCRRSCPPRRSRRRRTRGSPAGSTGAPSASSPRACSRVHLNALAIDVEVRVRVVAHHLVALRAAPARGPRPSAGCACAKPLFTTRMSAITSRLRLLVSTCALPPA